MKHYGKLLLWGLVPIPFGYLANHLVARGITLYPLIELACLAGWGALAYWLCNPKKGIPGQSACLCAAGVPALALAWVWTYGAPEVLPLAVSVAMQHYFNPIMLLFARNVGQYFYTLMGNGYNILPVYAASWLVMIGVCILGMWLKKRDA